MKAVEADKGQDDPRLLVTYRRLSAFVKNRHDANRPGSSGMNTLNKQILENQARLSFGSRRGFLLFDAINITSKDRGFVIARAK